MTFESAIWSNSGLYISNVELFKKLAECTEITNLVIYGYLNYNYYKLDLSKCKKLKIINSYYAKICFKVPENVTYRKLGEELSTTVSDLTEATNLKNIVIQIESNISTINNWNKQLSNCLSLENITIVRVRGNGDCTNFDLLKNCTKLKSIKIATEDSNYICTGNLSGFGQIKSLENLETLNLTDNSISNVEALKNLNKLSSLNLSNNCIYDISTDSNGNSFNNLEILANLNKNGRLRTLYLSGNSGITDWSFLSKIKNWESKSGF